MSGTVTPSPAAAFSSATLADSEKADVRRFCGYPPYGLGQSGFQGWRFFQAYGLLEYRMNNMNPAEYQNIRYYLSQLYALESGVWTAATQMGNDEAGPWKRNRTERQDRRALYRQVRTDLCALVGVPPGPMMDAPGVERVV
jgi:hypothetical protein